MATKYSDVHVKVDPAVKAESEKILSEIGISMSDLVNMTLRRLNRVHDIPFSTSLVGDFDRVSSRKDLDAYLGRVAAEDDGTRIDAEKVWSDMDDYLCELKTERKGAKIQSTKCTR